jgi:hypothetical protein
MRKPRENRPVNNLLGTLHDSDYALISPHLEEEQMLANALLYNPGDNVEIVYFPCGPTLVSFLVSNEDGRDVEAILVGRIVVKFGGLFMRLPVSYLEAAKNKSPALRYLFGRYADCLLAQVFQSTACNAIHSVEQRTAKWIISAVDRTDTDVVPLTHEQLASLLGVGRSYASRVIQTFKSEGILETRRGFVVVRNYDALSARSCLCNNSVKVHFDSILRGVYPT